MSLPANITHLLFLDFEATCEPNNADIDPREIIEFPCILVQVRISLGAKIWREVDTFHEYVRPVRHPKLSRFCVDLTGIRQWQVDSADPFPVVFNRFIEWLRRHNLNPESTLFVVDNRWDLGEMLVKQLHISGMSQNVSFNMWLNVKTAYLRSKFGLLLRYPYTNLSLMLEDLGMRFEGREHSGIDDARNIMRLYKKIDDLGGNFLGAIETK